MIGALAEAAIDARSGRLTKHSGEIDQANMENSGGQNAELSVGSEDEDIAFSKGQSANSSTA